MTIALGHRSVADCQDAVSSREFSEWVAYDSLEPIIPPWHVYLGTLAASITNTMRHKKSDKIWTWEDFFPSWDYEAQPQTLAEQIAIVELLNEAFGGIDKRNEVTTA